MIEALSAISSYTRDKGEREREREGRGEEGEREKRGRKVLERDLCPGSVLEWGNNYC